MNDLSATEARRLLGYPPLERNPQKGEAWRCWIAKHSDDLWRDGYSTVLLFAGFDGLKRPVWTVVDPMKEFLPAGPATIVPLWLEATDSRRPYQHLSRRELDAVMAQQIRAGQSKYEEAMTKFNQNSLSNIINNNSITNSGSYTISTSTNIGEFPPPYDVTYKAVWDPMRNAYSPQQIKAAPPGQPAKAIAFTPAADEDPIKWLRRRVEEICWKPA